MLLLTIQRTKRVRKTMEFTNGNVTHVQVRRLIFFFHCFKFLKNILCFSEKTWKETLSWLNTRSLVSLSLLFVPISRNRIRRIVLDALITWPINHSWSCIFVTSSAKVSSFLWLTKKNWERMNQKKYHFPWNLKCLVATFSKFLVYCGRTA